MSKRQKGSGSDKIYLFHPTLAPKGQMFNLEVAQRNHDKMVDEGWVDSPAGFKDAEKPQDSKGPTDASPKQEGEDDLLTIEVFTDAELLNELESREILPQPTKEQLIAYCEEYGIAIQVAGDGAPKDKEPLINRFYQSPTSLTKEELIILGNDRGVSLRMNMNEQTMITRITETLKPAGQE